MKRSSIVWQLGLLAVIGCSGQPAPVASSTPTETPPAQTASAATETEGTAGEAVASKVPETDDAAVTFVSLKVPNMH